MYALAFVFAGVARAAFNVPLKRPAPATPELCGGQETFTCSMSRSICDVVDVQGWTHTFLK
jgi:hypothetical protein